MQFVRFVEINDHEGETWSFWLQVDGNEDQIAKLRDLLDETASDDVYDINYALTEDIEPRYVVDKLVKYATGDYMPSHQKVVGVFTCPDTLGEDADDLYKGGIRDHFK